MACMYNGHVITSGAKPPIEGQACDCGGTVIHYIPGGTPPSVMVVVGSLAGR